MSIPRGAWVTLITPYVRRKNSVQQEGSPPVEDAAAAAATADGVSADTLLLEHARTALAEAREEQALHDDHTGDEGQEEMVVDHDALRAMVRRARHYGLAGVFAVCQSSEMYALSDAERLAAATTVAAAARAPLQVGGGLANVPPCAVVAGGTFPEHAADPAKRAAFVREMAAVEGVAAVVVIASALFGGTEESDAGASDEEWRAAVQDLLERTPGVPLGLYECPKPRHRLLTPDMLAWCADTGRFLFHKDTCCTIDGLRAKLAALRGASEKARGFLLFNANVATLSESMRMGAAGFCGIAANCYPALFAALCRLCDAESATGATSAGAARIADIQHRLSVYELTVAHKYPQSAKLFLRLCCPAEFGAMSVFSRVCSHEFADEDLLRLGHLGEISLGDV